MSDGVRIHEGTYVFPHGITVAELKGIVAQWPDTDDDGKPNEVWSYDGEGRVGQVRKIQSETMSRRGAKFNLVFDTDGRI